LAPGGIAAMFVDAAHAFSSQRFVAAGSRSLARAQEFVAKHGIARAHGSYPALVEDPEVDVVYVASTHNTHAELALLAIAAGKHVLIEKPFAVTRAEAEEVAAAARAAGVLAMEAMWTRYIPQADVIRQLLAAGTIGEVRMVAADFGFPFPHNPTHRLLDPAQAGGALLDAGVYPVSFASSVLGAPIGVRATGRIGPTGVDVEVAMLMDHGDTQSVALTSLTASLPVRATIMGSAGRIEVHRPFFGPTGITLQTGGFAIEENVTQWVDKTLPKLHDGLYYEADALARFVGEGRTESLVHTLAETVAIIGTLEDARRQVLGQSAAAQPLEVEHR
jgi:predicted dehydrogenase